MVIKKKKKNGGGGGGICLHTIHTVRDKGVFCSLAVESIYVLDTLSELGARQFPPQSFLIFVH